MKSAYLSNSKPESSLFQDLPIPTPDNKPVYSLLVFEDVVELHGFFDFVQKWAKESRLNWIKPVKGLTPISRAVKKALGEAIRLRKSNEIEVSVKWLDISHRDRARASCNVYIEFLTTLKSFKQTAYSKDVQVWVKEKEIRFHRIIETITLTRN